METENKQFVDYSKDKSLVENKEIKDINLGVDNITNIDESKKNKHYGKIIFFIILFFAIAGTSLSYYYFYFKLPPNKVLTNMILKIGTIESLEYENNLDILAKIPEYGMEGKKGNTDKEKENFQINVKGGFDLKNNKNFSTIEIRTSILKELTSKEENIISFEMKMVDNVGYFRILNTPKIPDFNLDFIINKWVKVDFKKAKEDFNLENLDKGLEKKDKLENLDTEKVNKLKELVANTNGFSIVEKSYNKKIDGKSMYYFKFRVVNEDLKKYFEEFNNIFDGEIFTEEELIELNNFIDDLDVFEGEIYIGKRDSLLYQMSLFVKYKEDFEFKTNTSLKNYNKEIIIEIPEETKTLEEIFSQFSSFLQ